MGQSIVCAYCQKPLVDTEHAVKHVVDQCENSPHKVMRDQLNQTNILLAILVEDAGGEIRIPFGKLEMKRAQLLSIEPLVGELSLKLVDQAAAP